MQDAAFEYVPRRPEATVLYGVVAGELETFLAQQEARDRHLPKFVEDEFRAFLDCGVLARGFIRVGCASVRIIAAIEDPTVVERILHGLALPSKPPPIAPARYERCSYPEDFAS